QQGNRIMLGEGFENHSRPHRQPVSRQRRDHGTEIQEFRFRRHADYYDAMVHLYGRPSVAAPLAGGSAHQEGAATEGRQYKVYSRNPSRCCMILTTSETVEVSRVARPTRV